MTLKPCPNPECRSTDVHFGERGDYVYCNAFDCCMAGPDNDPTGEKWNNMLRVEDVDSAFQAGLTEAAERQRDLDRRMGK